MMKRSSLLKTNVFVLMSVLWLLSQSALASFQGDLSLQVAGRSYPLGGGLDLEAGMSWLAWGKARSSSPWYGYGRFALTGTTAGSYNSGEVQASIYPVSFFGVTAGAMQAKNTKTYQAYENECESFQCEGEFSADYIRADLALAVGSVFLLARGENRSFKPTEEEQSYIDPTLGLLIPAPGEELRQYRGVLGFRWSKNWALTALGRYAELRETGHLSRSSSLNLVYQKEAWSVIVGGGVFRSELLAEGGAAQLLIRWSPWKSPGLF